ncbi:hypothetical protein Pcinc_024490 [Petrolisthes cinctipes]|uniref:Uncharacterized protein n=1 Tax=Petrolisthes cinctipes TaxID=88211 RepID=A0AAE1KF78_PETCI|nr:hypothetical protein Pcinc_024490 [Petrolisthes cinctipes]
MEAATTSGSSRILKLFTIAMTTAGYSSCSLLQDIQAVYYCNEYCRIFTVHYCRILKLIFRLYSHVKNTTPVSSKNSDTIVTFYYYMLSFGEEEDIFDITFRLVTSLGVGFISRSSSEGVPLPTNQPVGGRKLSKP